MEGHWLSDEQYLAHPDGDSVLAAWETAGQVLWALLGTEGQPPSPPVRPSAVGQNPQHPVAAGTPRDEGLLVWTEGTGWAKGGDVAWQRFDPVGKPIGERGRVTGLPAWSMAAAAAAPADGLVIVY